MKKVDVCSEFCGSHLILLLVNDCLGTFEGEAYDDSAPEKELCQSEDFHSRNKSVTSQPSSSAVGFILKRSFRRYGKPFLIFSF